MADVCSIRALFFTRVKSSTSIHVLYNNHVWRIYFHFMHKETKTRKVSHLPIIDKAGWETRSEPNSSPSCKVSICSPLLVSGRSPLRSEWWGCQMRTSVCYKSLCSPTGHRNSYSVLHLVCAMGDDGFGEARYFLASLGRLTDFSVIKQNQHCQLVLLNTHIHILPCKGKQHIWGLIWVCGPPIYNICHTLHSCPFIPSESHTTVQVQKFQQSLYEFTLGSVQAAHP